MGDPGPSRRRKTRRHRDDDLEDDLNSATVRRNANQLRAMEEPYVPAPPVPVPPPFNQHVNAELGLGFWPGMYREVVGSSDDDDEVGSPTLIHPQSPQNSLDSVSSTNVRPDMPRACDLLMAVSVCADPYKDRIIELAMAAMDELTKMAIAGEPLWQRRGGVNQSEILNGLEYLREFGTMDATLKEIMKMVEVGDFQSLSSLEENSLIPRKPRFESLRTEASRAIGIITMNPINVVELLMDLKKWSSTFCNMVSRATLLGVLSTEMNNLVLQVDLRGSTGPALNYDKMLQVMSAEFHLPTAFVPARESQFARYCKRLSYGTWAVVDVSLESLFPYPNVNFRRRPSGCLIQQLPHGCSKVTWVEHMEVDNELVHPIFLSIVSSGFAFCAKRWVATIIRHCKSQATLMDIGNPAPVIRFGVIPQAGRTSLLKVAERMNRKFWAETCASSENRWMTLSGNGAEDIRVRTKANVLYEMLIPSIVFTTTVRHPVPPRTIFNLLRQENSRNKWDMLAYGYLIQELAHVVKGENPENRVSVMQVNATASGMAIYYVQETYTDETGSYMIYAPMDMHSLSLILNGGDPDEVIMLPSGFAILPDRSSGLDGTILTITYNIIDNKPEEGCITSESIESVHTIITATSTLIKIVLLSDDVNAPVVESNSVQL